jgi:hypothetical protein
MIPPASPEDSSGFLPAGGNYQELQSYKKSEIIYDFTFRFCERFLSRGDRTNDQMVPPVPENKTSPKAARPPRPRRKWS